jgi:HIRAN domain
LLRIIRADGIDRGIVMPQQRVARSDVHAGSWVSPGAELLSLCQTAAADGALSRHQLRLVKAWLEHSGEFEVPARDYVREVVEHVLRTGKVTPADQQALARALEPCLPPQLKQATLRLVGSDRMHYSDDSAAQRTSNDILASACFMLAGCPSERRSPFAARFARAGDPVLLVRAREDAPEPTTIHVCTGKGRQLGFVPAHRAKALAPLLDRGARYRAHLISVSSGMHAPVLIVQAFLYRGDAVLGFQQASARRIAPRNPRIVWAIVRIAIALTIAAAVALVLRA